MADTGVPIARCPEHGLHGQRESCLTCGGPVEQVPMVPAQHLEQEVEAWKSHAADRERERNEWDLEAQRLERERDEAREALVVSGCVDATTWRNRVLGAVGIGTLLGQAEGAAVVLWLAGALSFWWAWAIFAVASTTGFGLYFTIRRSES